MPQIKETAELNSLLGSLINASVKSYEDKQINFADVGNLIDPLLKGDAAIRGVGLIPSELGDATPKDKTDAATAFAVELGALGQDDTSDLTAVLLGVQSGVSMIVRKSRKDTLTQLAAALNSQPVAQSGTYTAELLESMLAAAE